MRLLYVDFDSLRPDHLSCNGYARPTSPTIDRVAAEGVRFEHCYASDSPCVPSRAACFSGRPGIRNGVIAHENTPLACTMRYTQPMRHGQSPMMAQHLARSGVHTCMISTFADRHLAGWFNFGFREVQVDSLKGGDEDASEVNATALPWFERNAARDNWFVHLNYWDAHTLYTMPTSYACEMGKYPAPAWPDQKEIDRQNREDLGQRSARHLWGLHPHDGFGKSRVPETMPDVMRTRADYEHLINGYDGGIRYADEHFGRIVAMLEQQGVLDETAIIVSGDHGEAFGELGQYFEHGTASRSVQRVPMIVRWPGVTTPRGGGVRTELASNLDLAPTVAEMFGLPVPTGWCGRSLAPALRGEALPSPREHLVWSHGFHTRQRAVFDGRWLYIRTYDASYYLYPPQMLFDTVADPNETANVAEANGDVVRRLDEILKQWERDAVVQTGLPDPMKLAQETPPGFPTGFDNYVKRLRDEGDDAAADRLVAFKARHAPAYRNSWAT